MAIKINTHWIKVVWLTAPRYSFLQTFPIVKTPKKMKSHTNDKTNIDETGDKIILSRKQKLD